MELVWQAPVGFLLPVHLEVVQGDKVLGGTQALLLLLLLQLLGGHANIFLLE